VKINKKAEQRSEPIPSVSSILVDFSPYFDRLIKTSKPSDNMGYSITISSRITFKGLDLMKEQLMKEGKL